MTSIDRQLIERAVGGDRFSLTKLLLESSRGLQARIERRLPARLRSLVDAEDVLQQTYAAVFRKITAFSPTESDSFERWLAVIALRQLRRAIRSHEAAKRGGGWHALAKPVANPDESVADLLEYIHSTNHTPSRSLAGRERVAALVRALEVLTPEQREAVRLVYLEGLDATEAAVRMNKSPRAVYNLCDRAKQALRASLDSRSNL